MAEINVDALINLYNARVAQLADLASDATKHHVTYDIDGQKVSKTEYQKMLTDSLAKLKTQIDATQDPFEIETEAHT